MMRFVGGAYWPGVVGRDMSDAEWGELPAEMQAVLLATGVFEVGESLVAEVNGQVAEVVDEGDEK